MISFKKKQLLGLACDRSHSILLKTNKTKGGISPHTIVATTDSPIESDVSIPRLLASAGNVKGDVSITLPLEYFEVVSINVPRMPDESVGKIIPYHLGKVLDESVSNFIYDWQITHRLKENLKINVYLYPAADFEKMRSVLGKHQLQITHFEPDVFSALSYLDQEKRLPSHDPVMCLLLWQKSLSFAVYHNNMISMVRTIMTNQPTEESFFQEEKEPSDITEEIEIDNDAPKLSFYTESDDSGESLLADFNLSISSEDKTSELQLQPELSSVKKQPEKENDNTQTQSYDFSCQKYLSEINLEIMRTRDYYSSVLKGGAISSIIIGGFEQYWDQLHNTLTSSSEFKVEQLFPDPPSLPCQPLLAAVGQGTITGRP